MVQPNKTNENGEESREEDSFLMAQLEAIGSNKWFVAKIFFLCMIPSILNGVNVTSSVYLAEVPTHWCYIHELDTPHWSTEKIRLLSAPNPNASSCTYYDLDYNSLAEMSFEAAWNASRSGELREIPCKSVAYSTNVDSITSEFYLMCQDEGYHPLIQFSLSLGKFLGAFTFGVISDNFGRRTSFFLGSLLFIIAGPTIAISSSFWLIIAGRIGIGAAGAGIYHSAFVILSEIASKRLRGPIGIIYNMSYPIGQMITPLISYYCRHWRTLQYIISLPAIFTLVFWWFLPESPMWLLSKNKKEKAAKFIKREYAKIRDAPPEDSEMQAALQNRVVKPAAATAEAVPDGINESRLSKMFKKLYNGCKQVGEIITNVELLWRLLFSIFTWCVVSFSYYGLALNVDNFGVDRYLYGFLTGLIEVPSYLVPLPLLKWMGRRHTAILLFFVAAASMFLLLLIPEEHGSPPLLLTIVSVGRLCVSGVFAVLILMTTELFPTLQRNTAIGLSSTSSHVGSMLAPYFVHFVGKLYRQGPSTIIGLLALMACTLVFVMPETKGKPLPTSTQEILDGPKESKVGFHQICHR